MTKPTTSRVDELNVLSVHRPPSQTQPPIPPPSVPMTTTTTPTTTQKKVESETLLQSITAVRPEGQDQGQGGVGEGSGRGVATGQGLEQGQGRMVDGNSSGTNVMDTADGSISGGGGGGGGSDAIVVSGSQNDYMQSNLCWWCGSTSTSTGGTGSGSDVIGLTPSLPTTATTAATNTLSTTSALPTAVPVTVAPSILPSSTSTLPTTTITAATTTISTANDVLHTNAATLPLNSASIVDRPIVRILSGYPLPYTLSTHDCSHPLRLPTTMHPFNTPYQHTLSMPLSSQLESTYHPLTLLTHPFNPPYQALHPVQDPTDTTCLPSAWKHCDTPNSKQK